MHDTKIIPDPTRTYEDWQRSEHLDLPTLDPQSAWAELILLRQHLAAIVWQRRRRLRIVRLDAAGDLTDERGWTIERIARLERLLARRGRAA